jgi:hypothetical protein
MRARTKSRKDGMKIATPAICGAVQGCVHANFAKIIRKTARMASVP